MSGILWRTLFAVIAVVLAIAIIPPVCRIIGFEVSGDLWLVVRLCIAGLAILYIIKGKP